MLLCLFLGFWRAVHSIVVARETDVVDEHRYRVSYMNGDMGDGLGGRKMTLWI